MQDSSGIVYRGRNSEDPDDQMGKRSQEKYPVKKHGDFSGRIL